MFKILDKQGGRVSAPEQAVYNKISTNNSDGYIDGYLNSFNISKSTSNSIIIDTGILSVQGFRVVNESFVLETINMTPSSPVKFHTVGIFTHYSANENDTFIIASRPVQELRKENLYANIDGAVYEVELCKYTLTSEGITEFKATLPRLNYSVVEIEKLLESANNKADKAEQDSADALQKAQDAVDNVVERAGSILKRNNQYLAIWNVDEIDELVKTITLEKNTGILTITAFNGQVKTIDLPTEFIIRDGSYDNISKTITFILENGQELVIPIGDLISGLATTEQVTAVDTKATRAMQTATANSKDILTKLDKTGVTYRFNQLIRFSNFINSRSFASVVYTNDGTILKFKGQGASGQGNDILLNFELIKTHKYFISVNALNNPNVGATFRLFTDTLNYTDIDSGLIFSNSAKITKIQFISRNYVYDMTARPILIDLTEMFGEGNEPNTATELYQYITKGTYYPYTDYVNKAEVNSLSMALSDTQIDISYAGSSFIYTPPTNGWILVSHKANASTIGTLYISSGTTATYEINTNLSVNKQAELFAPVKADTTYRYTSINNSGFSKVVFIPAKEI